MTYELMRKESEERWDAYYKKWDRIWFWIANVFYSLFFLNWLVLIARLFPNFEFTWVNVLILSSISFTVVPIIILKIVRSTK
jgi:ABC-type dipeptide/oligopeptide/nickel transport system permease subunit